MEETQQKHQTTPCDGLLRIVKRLYEETVDAEAGFVTGAEGGSSEGVNFKITLTKEKLPNG